MRVLVKVRIPVEAGNTAIRTGKLDKIMQGYMADIKPEASYFYTEDGLRTALFVVNMTEASELPKIAEPGFLAFNARVDVYPLMLPEDLMKAGPSLEAAAKKYT